MKKNIFTELLILIILFLFTATGCSLFENGDTNTPIPTAPDMGTALPYETPDTTQQTLPTQPASTDSSVPTPVPTAVPTVAPTPVTITISAIGDFMAHDRIIEDAYVSPGNYDFSHMFSYLKDTFSQTDYLIANFEGSLAGGPNYAGYPIFNCPEQIIDNIRDIGVDLMAMAGNHSMDHGIEGLRTARNFLDSKNVKTIGIYTSYEERQKTHGTYIEVINGIKVGFLNYTYSTNMLAVPVGHEYAVNLLYSDYMALDPQILLKEQILSDIQYLKAQNIDIMVAMMHMGDEYRTEQNYKQELVAQFLFENGVDVMFGNHTHCIEPIEIRDFVMPDGTTKKVFCCFSLGSLLGNFYSDNSRVDWAVSRSNNLARVFATDGYDTVRQFTVLSVMANVKITKNYETGKTVVEDWNYAPLYQFIPGNDGIGYHCVDVNKSLALYDAGDRTQSSICATTNFRLRLEQALKICHAILDPTKDLYYKAK